jgi:4-hydroxybenzoate polyprenyltransferase
MFRRLIAYQTRKTFSVLALCAFVTFVGGVRILEEWALGGPPIVHALSSVYGFVVFYFTAFFAFAAIVRALVPGDFRHTINPVFVGIFLGLLPPLIDYFADARPQFFYFYNWGFPKGFSPWLYDAGAGTPIGETIVLWMTIAFTAAYVGERTRSAWRSIAAAALAYFVLVTLGALLPTAIDLAMSAAGWRSFKGFFLTLAQLGLALVCYFVLRPSVLANLARRLVHTLPFALICLVGGAFAGWRGGEAFVYAGLVAFLFVVALVQNDHFDAADDERSGRTPYADAEDARFFSALGALAILAILVETSSSTGVPLLVIFGLSFLYSYPFYRAKKHFPANLKIEGSFGALSFLVGVIAAVEGAVLGAPAWGSLSECAPNCKVVMGPLPPATLVAVLLVFLGFSLVAALKDHKDIDADRAAGVTTIYTLAERRGWPLERVHRIVVTLSCVALLLPMPLLASIERAPWAASVAPLPFVALLAFVSRRSRGRFGWTLLLVSLVLASLVITLA